jgi:hypothetical protein
MGLPGRGRLRLLLEAEGMGWDLGWVTACVLLLYDGVWS